MDVEPTVAAYLAGVIDSDGYITTTRGFHSGVMYSGAKIGIAGTRREPHDLAASLFGGKVSRYEPKNPRHRAQFQWSRSGEAALAMIKVVYPYLRIKRAQADLAVTLQGFVWELPWLYPSTCTRALDAMHKEMRELNQSRRHVATP